MRRLAALLLVSLALVVTVAACGGDDDSSAPSEPGAVAVKDNFFSPKSASVKVGDTVTWTFEGKSAHNVTFDDFNSKLMKTGTYTHTFDEAGSFEYHCTIHTGMSGKVVVSSSAAP
jgi:plastocyanin